MSVSVKRLDFICHFHVCVSVCIFLPDSRSSEIYLQYHFHPCPHYMQKSILSMLHGQVWPVSSPWTPKSPFSRATYNAIGWMSATLASLYPYSCAVSSHILSLTSWSTFVMFVMQYRMMWDQVSPIGTQANKSFQWFSVYFHRRKSTDIAVWQKDFFFHCMSVPQGCAYKPVTPFFIHFHAILPDAILCLVWKRLLVHSLVLSVTMAFPPSRLPSLSWYLLSMLPHSIFSCLFSPSPFLSLAPPLLFSIFFIQLILFSH